MTLNPIIIEKTPARRHDSRVERVSTDPALLKRLDRLVVAEDDARRAIETVCRQVGVPVPAIKFHARRSAFTGATEPPRSWQEARMRMDDETRTTADNLLQHGAIRLGRATTLMTVAHELGHHLVFHLDPVVTPPHGNRWVARFDEAAAVIEAAMRAETLR